LNGNRYCREVLIEQGLIDEVTDCGAKAIEYESEFGWAVVPQIAGTKKPCVKWKQIKDDATRPPKEQIEKWYCRWPNAGIVVLLGPVSDLFAIDIDGEEAHNELENKLGKIPLAPSSWRGEKYRYHLLFRLPEGIRTWAKITPWHSALEFRGHGGYIVLPPSRHPSGQRYEWKDGLSPFEIPLPEVPADVLEALLKHTATKINPRVPSRKISATQAVPVSVEGRPSLSTRTNQFLLGEFANGPQWNDKLFAAACDMAGNWFDQLAATKLLLAGAQPWNAEETQNALATIASAYSEERIPAKKFYPQTTKNRRKRNGFPKTFQDIIKVENN